jgi:Family of unknown function (DUF6494)
MDSGEIAARRRSIESTALWGNARLPARMALTVSGVGLSHQIAGVIELD